MSNVLARRGMGRGGLPDCERDRGAHFPPRLGLEPLQNVLLDEDGPPFRLKPPIVDIVLSFGCGINRWSEVRGAWDT